jgi:hypothetical protein
MVTQTAEPIMQFTHEDLWGVIFGAIAPAMTNGTSIGALESNVPGRPFIEWAYSAQDDTLLLLCFIGQPEEGDQPWKQFSIPQFGAACLRAAQGAAACVQAFGGCGNPDCTECGGDSSPYRMPFGAARLVGFHGRPKSEDDFIGFRPRRK